MKKRLFIIVLALNTGWLQAQDFIQSGSLSQIINHKISRFSILDTLTGNLNRDLFQDLVILYKRNDEEDPENQNDFPVRRPLVIYTGQKDGTFMLSAQNDNIVLCHGCYGVAGDPFPEIKIVHGYLFIDMYGGSGSSHWNQRIRFKYSKDQDNWYLDQHTSSQSERGDVESSQTEYLSSYDYGQLPFDEFDIYADNPY